MNDQEYKEKLAQVAEWTLPKITGTGNPKKIKKGRKTLEEQYQEAHEQEFIDLFDGKNPTVQPVITNVKVQGCMCDDCGRFCEQGRKTEITRYSSNRPHWRERCVTCGMNKNPYTGAWDLTNKDASAHWANWLRKTSVIPYLYNKKTIRIQPEQNQDD
jgi:hypothetical protein